MFSPVFNIVFNMNLEFYIAKRIRTSEQKGGNGKAIPSLNIAVIGMTTAIVIMILSITVVCGFKSEISSKIYNLDSHIKIRSLSSYSGGEEFQPIADTDVIDKLADTYREEIKTIGLIAEKSVVLKTQEDFKGIVYRGVDKNYDWSYWKSIIIDGRTPQVNDSSNVAEIIISKFTANQLKLSVGDKIYTYFIDDKVKIRNSKIVGIYNSDLEDFDKTYILGNIRQIQSVNGWDDNTGTYIGIDCRNSDNIDELANNIYNSLNNNDTSNDVWQINTTTKSNLSYFTWLGLLDMNVLIILIIMLAVTSFTIISAMLMIVLERVRMIGILKTLGSENRFIRKIFIFLTFKLIFKSLIIGNLIGLITTLLQHTFHIIKLDAEAYYVSYVPVEINWIYILLLNIGIISVAYISLIAPSHIISKIEPNKTVRFE